jgi:hypothetical protein
MQQGPGNLRWAPEGFYRARARRGVSEASATVSSGGAT